MSHTITKTDLLAGIRCPRLLWLRKHRPDLKTETEESLSIEEGIAFGKLARQRYPDGQLIDAIENPAMALVTTQTALKETFPSQLFEAAFQHDGILVRSDILVTGRKGARLVEAKSASSVKQHHLIDCAVQLYVLEGAGIKVSDVCLALVDSDFEIQEEGEYGGLIYEENVTNAVRELLPSVTTWVAWHKKILAGPEPKPPITTRCDDCAFLSHCESELPDYPLNVLPFGGKIIKELETEGYKDIRDIPEGRLQNSRHLMVWAATRNNTPYISPILRTEFAKLPYTRYYLDFESINFLIPRWVGVRPRQQIPFQWSCHIEQADGSVRHEEYLERQGLPPMREFAESLIAVLEREGPIIVYGTFESMILKQLIPFCPDLEQPLRAIMDRLVDLLPWMREHYYHPAMKGSWSIKAILPTIAPHLDYALLEEVRNGVLAQQAYLEIIHSDTSPDRRDKTVQNLLRYCELDTLAMLEVVRYFENN